METNTNTKKYYKKSYLLITLSLIITALTLFNWYNQRIEVFGGGAVGGGGSSSVPVNYSGSANQYVLEDGKIVFFTLANEAEGGFYMDSSQTGQKTAFSDYYSAMTGTTNASSFGLMDNKLSNKQSKFLNPRYFTAGEAGTATYSMSPGDANRIISSAGANGTYAKGLFLPALQNFVTNNGGLETLVSQDGNGVPTWKSQILQPLGDYKELSRVTLGFLVGDGYEAMSDRFNDFVAGDMKDKLDDLPSLTPEQQSELTLRYIDLLLCCYSVAEGTTAEGEWQAAIENYINGGGNGTIQQYSDNKANIILTPGVAYNIGDGPQKGTHFINGWDALAVNMGITVSNDLSKHETAEAIAGAVGRDLYEQIYIALQNSKVENPALGRTWYMGNSAYFNSTLTNLLLSKRPVEPTGWKASSTGRSFMNEMFVMYSLDGTRHYGLNAIAPNPTKGGVSIKSDLTTVASWGGPNDSNTVGGGGTGSINNGKKKTSFLFGNLWEESDKNKMYNEGTAGEKSSLQNYRGSVANAVNANQLMETAQENASLSLSATTQSKNDWAQIFNANSKYKISFTIRRTDSAIDISNKNETVKGGYKFVTPDFYIAGKQYKSGDKIDISEIGWNKNDLQSFIYGTKPLDLILDKSTYNQLVENNTRVEMKFNVTMVIYYGNSEDKMSVGSTMSGITNAIEVTRVDYPMNTTGQFKYVEFHSNPLGYSELKEGTIQMDGDGSNETWEAMAGVPSTETLYFASGGSEFITEVHMQYIPKEKAKRTYRSAYQGIECEYKVPDTMPLKHPAAQPTKVTDGYGGTSGQYDDQNIQCTHTGFDGTIVARWEGDSKCTQVTSSCSVCGSGTIHRNHVLDPSDYNSAKAAANALVASLNAENVSWTSGSDKQLREYKWSASITTNTQDTSDNTNKGNDGSSGCGEGHETCGGCTDDEGGNNCSAGSPHSEGSGCPGHHHWKIVVTATIPDHVVCGPCHNHNLPAVEDNWDQEFTYSYMRINSVKTWKIDRSYVDGMDEITYHETDVVKNDIVQGDPNVFYNIADLNPEYLAQSKEQLDYYVENGDLPEKKFVTVGSQAGRLRYSLQAQQHDAVTWLENNGGKRTNKCNGDAGCGTICPQNPKPVPFNQGHNNVWSVGILYNNPSPTETQVNDEMWWSHQYAGAKKANGNITQQWDDVDKKTTEWTKFKERRDTPNTVAVLSDMLILQTSTGDQSVLYYSRTQTRNSDKHFDYNADDYGKSSFNTGGVSYTDKTFSKSEQLYSTFDEIYTNNDLSSSDWDETTEINIGGYNGKFKTPSKKFSGTNKKTIKTLFDKDGQGDGSFSDSLGNTLSRKVTDTSANVPGVDGYETPGNNVAKHNDILNNNSYLAAPVNYEYRQNKVDRLRLITDEDHPWDYGEHTIRQNPINSNKEYVTGDAYVFYKPILDYERETTEEGRIFIYNFENETNDVLGDRGVTIDAPYSDNHDKINNIVVHDPVSVDRAMLISLPSERDQRVDGSSASSTESTLAKLEASQVCPGTAALCEYRVLNCKYFDDTVVGNFDFNEGEVVNKITNIEYRMPSGFSISNGVLNAYGTRLQIPLSDLGLAFSKSLRLKVEADITVDSGATNTMIFSFNNYDLYLTEGGICFNTGNSYEYGNKTNIADGQKHKIEAIFDFGIVQGTTGNSGCSLKIDGRNIPLTKNNESKKLEAGMIGSTFNIGSWGLNDSYPAKMKVDNLKITKLGGSDTHTDSCYETVMVHAKTKKYTCDHSVTFDFKNKVQTYVVPETGYYKIEAWGAQGGDGTGTDSTNVPSRGGLGGYSSGNVYLVKGQILNVYTGGRGGYSTENGVGGQPSQTYNFNYTGGVQEWTCPESGTYNIETWGAQGGNASGSTDSLGGLGGYSSGKRYFNAGDKVYIYVGGQGTYSSALGTGGGYNGGGQGGPGGYGGGGMTHISTAKTDNLTTGIKDASYMEIDPYGGTLIGSDDDSGSGLSARMTQYLTGGTKYVFFTSRFNTSQSGNTSWSISGPGLNLSGTDYIDEGSWADKTYDKDCLHVFTAPQTGNYTFNAYVGTLSDPTIFLYTYKEKKVEAYQPTNGGSFNSGAVIIAAGGGGGGDDSSYTGTVVGGHNDGAGGTGGGTSGGNPKIDGVAQGGYAGTQSSGYTRGYGQSAYVKTDTGGAGGGWFGGKVTNNNNGGAGGGSGYIGGVTNGSTTAGQRAGNGFARIKKEYNSAGYNGGGAAGSSGYGGGGGTDVRATRIYTLDDLMIEGGTRTYGPYIDLDAGTYQVTIYGNGFNKSTVYPDVYTNNGVNYNCSNIVKTNSKINYTVNISKDIKAGLDGSGLEFRLSHTNNSDYAFERVEIKSTSGDTSVQSRIIVAGGGGGADNAGGTLFGNDDGSGGAGGGLQGGSAFIDGKQVYPYTAQGGGATQTSGYKKFEGQAGSGTDTGGGGGGYYGATSSLHNNGGGGGGSAFTSGLSNSLTVAGVQHGNGKVKITPLDIRHNDSCPFEMSEYNEHIHNASCIDRNNEILIGAFLMEYNGDSQPLKTLIGDQAFNALNNFKSDITQLYDFTATNNAQFKGANCGLQNNSDGLILRSIASDSYIYNNNVSFPASAVNYIDVRLKIVGNSTNYIQAYWKTGYDGTYNEAKSVTGNVANNGTWQTVRLDVRGKSTWKDTITGLRFDLAGNNAAGGKIYVDKIELRGNGISKTTTQSTGLLYTYKGFKDDLSSSESGNGKVSYGITDGDSAASTTFSGGYIVNSGNLNGWEFNLPVNINNASALEVIGINIVNSTSYNSIGVRAYNSSGGLVGEAYADMTPNTTQTIYINTANWTSGNIAKLVFDTAAGNVYGSTKVSQIQLYGYGTSSGGQQSGGRYEYTTGGSASNNWSYTGGSQSWTAPYTGTYTFTLVGARGGSSGNGVGGVYGAKKQIKIDLTAGNTVQIICGGVGGNGGSKKYSHGSAGYNGGGNGSDDYNCSISDVSYGAGGGGGRTTLSVNGTLRAAGAGGAGRSGSAYCKNHGYSYWYGGAGGADYGNNITTVSNSTENNGGNGYASVSYNTYQKHTGDNYKYTQVSVAYNTPAIGSCTFQSGMTTGDITDIKNKIDILAKNYLNLIPDKVNGLPNPVFSCGWKFNHHNCNLTAGGCREEKLLTCSEPHHMNPATHYPGNNPICWDACHNDENHKQNKDEIEINGVLTRLGTFINTDYGFEIYFPNIGDFAQQTDLWGISSLTDIRGMSYVDEMDITKWTREKRIKFDFDTLFYNPSTEIWEQYLAGSWISLPILKPEFDYDEFTPQADFADNAYTHYKFYCTLNNQELASAKIQYESEAINAAASPGGKEKPYLRKIVNRAEQRNIDNTTYTTNRLRSTTFKSKHSAFKTSYVDVVGRIGNLFITDTEDMRFCNFFKMPTNEGWVIEGIVHTVNQAVQNNYLSWHNSAGDAYKDIRGIKVKKDTGMYNTWYTQSWNEDREYNRAHGKLNGSNSVDLPLTSKKNNISQLLSDPLKPGYNVFYEISTIGMYSSNMQSLPHFYALNLCADENGRYELTPVDVYMTVDNEYVPINYYDAFADGVVKPELKEKLFEHVMNLEWSAESVRRNYTSVEKYMTNELSKIFSETKKNTEVTKELSSPDNMIGFKYALGTLQLMNAEGYARTFIGSTYTNNEEFNKNSVDTLNIGDLNLGGGKHLTNVDELVDPYQFWYRAQRWHLKVGLPSSAVFVKYDGTERKIPTDVLKDKHGDIIYDSNGVPKMNYEEIQNGHYVIIMTTELTSYGERWTLAYDQEGYNGKAELPTYKIGMNGKEVPNGNKVFEFGTNFNGQEIKGTILAIYDAGDNSTVDIDITGTH